MRSNLRGFVGIASGACPSICVIWFWSPALAMFFCAFGNRSFLLDSIV